MPLPLPPRIALFLRLQLFRRLRTVNVNHLNQYYQRDANQLAPPELLAINPLGKSPIITDAALTLAESGAIIEYLISHYGKGKLQAPASGQGYIDDLYYTHYAEGSLMPTLVPKLIYDIVLIKTPFFIRPFAHLVFGGFIQQYLMPAFEKHFTMIEDHLNRTTTGWFAGGDEPTAADFMMAFPLEIIVAAIPNLARPKMIEYVKQVHDRYEDPSPRRLING
ncbi:hypothetical protein C0995_015773 [Termitomyces sp. Mi166|nr:hypothetical protein C0995_015773 [Termitomyces sp. Mi166\